MKTHLLMALVLFVFYPGALRKMAAQANRIGFTPAKLTKQMDALPGYANQLTNVTAALNLWQAPGHFVYLEGDQVQKGMKDMMSDISFEKFIEKYDCKKMEKQVRVTKFKFKDAYQRKVTGYSSLGDDISNTHQMNFVDDSLPTKTHWIFEYHEKTAFTKAFVQAFYVTKDFSSLALPAQYTNMVQQTKVAVDSSTQFLQDQLTILNAQLAETKQLQSSLYLLTTKAADRDARRKRRQEIVNGILSWLPLLLLAHK